jgi:ribosome biogenesis protein MAK21
LLYWAMEDGVKRRYAAFVMALEEISKDNLDYLREKAIKCAYALLAAKPELESKLLMLIVNKLGDPSRKVASRASYVLQLLLTEHPAMKLIVTKEVERFLYRPNLSDRARYVGVLFLSQILLDRHYAENEGEGLARRLIDIYFTLFGLIVDGKLGLAAKLEQEKVAKRRDGKKKKKKNENENENMGTRGGGGGGGDVDVDVDVAASSESRKSNKQTKAASTMDARILSALLTGVNRAFPYMPAEEVEPLFNKHSQVMRGRFRGGGAGGSPSSSSSSSSPPSSWYRVFFVVVISLDRLESRIKSLRHLPPGP